MKMNITLKTKVYLICPTYSLTGGPECIHQLTDMLKRYGHDARIVYLPQVPDPTMREYAAYNIRYTYEIEDSPHNLIIAPETMPNELLKYNNIQKAVWWLSVDNQFKHGAEKRFDWKRADSASVFHFAQSYYAMDYLRGQGVENPMLLTDYLPRRYLKATTTIDKNNQVAYFAKKNKGAIERFIEASPDIHWVPIENMTTEKVRQTLAKSKVYIDFGPHPGRDKMPREAAMQNCCIIIGNRGAAANAMDYPFPDDYKIELDTCAPRQVVQIIRRSIENYSCCTEAFVRYRKWICEQEDELAKQVVDYFGQRSYRRRNEHCLKSINYYTFYKNKVSKALNYRGHSQIINDVDCL